MGRKQRERTVYGVKCRRVLSARGNLERPFIPVHFVHIVGGIVCTFYTQCHPYDTHTQQQTSYLLSAVSITVSRAMQRAEWYARVPLLCGPLLGFWRTLSSVSTVNSILL